MNTDYYNTSDETEKRKSAGKIEKGLKRLIIIAAVIITGHLIWLFGVSPFIPFTTIDVHGFPDLQQANILAIAGINENSSFFSTNAKAIQDKLSSNVLVESAVVIKRFPDRLSIFLNPREAAAVALTNVNSRQVPVYIDRHGVFFKIGESGTFDFPDLPILSGIDNPQLNMRLPASLVTLVESIAKISSSSPELLSAISEIRIERKTWDGFDLVLFPVHSSIRVRVENNLTEHTLRYMLLMLNVFENEPKPIDYQKPHEIDFRSGMGSYIVKEQL
ncbi:MAG: FtsQ-type POTRA domain-containing protein [Treponema sp.]|nr:FtsQ-type POTRA domain-containing protein [Treponema sp.]